jgi:hypothetical protein
VLLDGSVIAAQNDQGINSLQTLRGHLSGSGSILAGAHEIRILIARNYVAVVGTTPEAYIDNVAIGDVPEPATWFVTISGLAGLALVRRFRR